MKYEYLYACDGMVESCTKENCHWNGNLQGGCKHTRDVGHARYAEPREWAWKSDDGKVTTFCEAVRAEDAG